MRPPRADIAAPELPGRLRWLNADRAPRVSELVAAGPLLVHFFDFAQLNSVRALPYVLAWRERYEAHGLTVLGVHSPRFRFTAAREALAAGVRRLGIEHPVADDSGYAVWHDYGCRGWPSLFLWGQGGALVWTHFGEGQYRDTEEAIQAELKAVDPGAELPAPLDPLRPSDAPEARVMPPSEEVFPGGSASEPWRGKEPVELAYSAGGAHASLAGSGAVRLALDGGPEREIAVDGPGLYDLAEHTRHERHRLRVALRGELALYSVAFSAGVP